MPPAVDESSPMLIEVRAVDGQGRGYFAKSDGGTIKAGTTVLESCSPIVSVVNDEYENRNCRRCLQPCYDCHETAASLPVVTLCCPTCLRSVLCPSCASSTAPPNSRPPSSSKTANDRHGLPSANSAECYGHDTGECEALAGLSALQREQPDLVESLLGSSTVYLRLLLRLLAIRAQERQAGRAGLQITGRLTSGVDELEDHLDDLLDGGEMEARMMNTVRAVKLVAPAAWKASQETCAQYLGKLYCNSMTIGKTGVSAPLLKRGYWSGIRGCLYTDFGVGLFPEGAMFNHSCEPNCAWQTDPSGVLRVAAVSNVPAGSQLFISYIDILQPRQTRRGILNDHFFFECGCSRCAPPRPPLQNRHPVRKTRRRSSSPVEPPPENSTLSTHKKGVFSPDADEEDLVVGSWICPKRRCCREGRVLRPPRGNTGDAHGDSEGSAGVVGSNTFGGGGDDDWNLGFPIADREREFGISAGSFDGDDLEPDSGRCNACGGFVGEDYFDRWAGILGEQLSAADGLMSEGKVREGRQKLFDLKMLCERRLVPTHAFTLGVHCRLMLAAAVDLDWPAAASSADRALAFIEKLRTGTKGETTAKSSCCRDSNSGRRGSESGGFEGTLVVYLQATAIWEAIVIGILDRALTLSRRGHERETTQHKARVASAEKTVAIWGLRWDSLVEL